MNKSDLIAILTEKTGIHHQRADRAVDAVFNAISQALARGERIELRGFGAWTAKHRRARDGRNPNTGEAISVPEKRHPSFTAGKDLSERIMRAWQRNHDGAAESGSEERSTQAPNAGQCNAQNDDSQRESPIDGNR